MTPAEMFARLEADGNALAEVVRVVIGDVPEAGVDDDVVDALREALANWDKRLWRATADERPSPMEPH